MIKHSLCRALHTTSNCLKKVVPNNIKGKSVSSAQWLTRQLADPYVEKAKMMNYRCRSAFKLIEMDDRFQFLSTGQVVIDCGAAPGSWTQVAVERVNADNSQTNAAVGIVIAVDKRQIYPIDNATILGNSDFTLPATQERIQSILQDRKVDTVISDMAPNSSGIRDLDNENILNLCYCVLRFAVLLSNIDATLVIKLWQNGDIKKLENDLLRFYQSVRIVKPNASRGDSTEVFFLARKFKGLKIS